MITRFFLRLSVILAAVIALTTRYVNEDLFGALAAGRDISRGLLFTGDHWSFTVPGLVWINQAWLSHLFFYLSYDTWGPLGPLFIKAVLFVACLGLVLLRCRSLSASVETSLVALLAGILAVAPFVGLRQENFGLFFFMAFSTLLVIPIRSRIGRAIAILAVLALWCNFHGSFMLGLGLLAAKALLVTLRLVIPRKAEGALASWKDAVDWGILFGVGVAVTAMANPYGVHNVTMPFKQLGTATVTEHSADWLPLLRFQQIDEGILAGGSVWPYVGLACILVAALIVVVVCTQRSPSPSISVLEEVKADWMMEAVIALVSVGLALRFGRLVLFSALSLVPCMALLLHVLVRHVRTSGPGDPYRSNREQTLVALASATLCGFMILLCWRVAVVPYLPGNPFRPARPVMSELMSFNSFSRPLTDFMKDNQLVDRVLCGWGLSPYVMWRVPEIRLFMDTRDQSYYPPHVMRDYFAIMGILPNPDADAFTLLERYGVETVALSTDPVDFGFAVRLMQSKKWACVYADAHAMLLVRSDAPRFRTMLTSGRLNALAFPDRTSRNFSEAMLSCFLFGRVSTDLVDALKEQALKTPIPNYYTLMCWGMDDPRACFAVETTRFLVSEANRLSQISPLYANGAEEITESLTRLYEILGENALRCGDQVAAGTFRAAKVSSAAQYRRLRRYYLGTGF